MKINKLSALLLALLTALSCAAYAFVCTSSRTLPIAAASADTVDDAVIASEAVGESASAGEFFTERDLEQSADLSEAVCYTVSDGAVIRISEEGVYVLMGSAAEAVVYVDAPDDAKVQLVLDGLTITNRDTACIYVENADKVFVTTSADSALAVTGTFQADRGDGAIFSRSDLALNGTAALTISSTANGIVGKDDLKITGGSYRITASSKAIDANDSIRIAGGSFALNAGTDGLHAENNDDDSLGWIYIGGGTFVIDAGDDGIHGTSLV